jgi:hypothetical protein
LHAKDRRLLMTGWNLGECGLWGLGRCLFVEGNEKETQASELINNGERVKSIDMSAFMRSLPGLSPFWRRSKQRLARDVKDLLISSSPPSFDPLLSLPRTAHYASDAPMDAMEDVRSLSTRTKSKRPTRERASQGNE